MSCIICYERVANYQTEETTKKSVCCADKTCTSKVCEDCFEDYLAHCLSEKSLVRCLNEYCKSFIIPKHKSELYNQVIVTAFVNSQGTIVNDIITKTALIQKMREEKRQFISKFPKAIDFVINVALKKKLNEITKQNKEHINKLLTDTNRTCMNSFCTGKLNKDFVCIKCDTQFCKKCEKIMQKNHTCKNEDIETIKMLSNMVKCPNCLINIERSYGCNIMRCTTCNTDFDYSTGQKISNGHGSNEYIGAQRKKILFEFKQEYNQEICDILTKIEESEPQEPSIISLNNAVKKVIENDKSVAVRTFEKYIIQKIEYVNFIKLTNEINQLHIKGTLSIDTLNTFVNL